MGVGGEGGEVDTHAWPKGVYYCNICWYGTHSVSVAMQVVLFVSMCCVLRFSGVDLRSLFILVDELIGLVWASCYRIPLGGFGCVFR